MTGYDALRQDAASINLTARGRIAATGEDRKRLLHAMSTNHIEQLTPGSAAPAFFLTAQGRILADALILCREDSLLLLLESETREKIYQHIDRYIIADDVTLDDVTASTAEFAVEGPAALSWLESQGAPIPAEPFQWTPWDDSLVLHASLTGAPGFRLIGPPSLAQRLASLPAASPDAVEAVRLEHGQPRYGADITEANLVHETGLLHAVSFHKGCYLGQEIVERVRSRGQVNRLLASLRLSLDAAPAPGTKIVAGEKEAGALTSAAWSPGEQCVFALGYVRAEALRSGSPLTVDGALAQVVKHA